VVRPDGKSGATLFPPAFGLAGANLSTWTGFGSVTYWNAFVANLERHGKGMLYDPRLTEAAQLPIAAKVSVGNTQQPRPHHPEARRRLRRRRRAASTRKPRGAARRYSTAATSRAATSRLSSPSRAGT